MRSALAAVAVLLLLGCGLAEAAELSDFDHATSTILCDCGCHPQSVKACACGRAAEMRGEIAAMVDRGMNGEAIVADYVSRFGEKILISPPATGFNLVAWIGPLIALFVAAGLMLMALRRLARRSAAIPKPAGATQIAADDPYQERLRQALKEMQ